jgi:hypothetical protein
VVAAVRPAMATPPATIAATRRREVFRAGFVVVVLLVAVLLVLVVMVVVFPSARPGPSVPTAPNLPRIRPWVSRPVR